MPQKSRRIAIFTTAFRPLVGGSELALENIIQRLPKIGFDIFTPRYQRRWPAREAANNWRLYRLGWGSPADKYFFPLWGAFQYWRLSRRAPYQAVHAYQASQAAGAAWLIKWLAPRTRFILTLQEGEALTRQSAWKKFCRRWLIRRADQLTAISRYLADFARQLNRHSPITLIPNGVNHQLFRQVRPEAVAALRAALRLKGSDRVVFTSSRLVKKNGLADLVAAFALTQKTFPDAKLLVIGDGPQRQQLEAAVRKLELTDEVLLLGKIGYHALPPYLHLADVFVRPALSEGLGTAFLEALAAGVPIIGTPVGGIPDFLVDGETGLFCRVNDPADLAAKLIQVLSDQALRRRLRANGQQLVERRYQWNDIARQFDQLYAHV